MSPPPPRFPPVRSLVVEDLEDSSDEDSTVFDRPSSKKNFSPKTLKFLNDAARHTPQSRHAPQMRNDMSATLDKISSQLGEVLCRLNEGGTTPQGEVLPHRLKERGGTPRLAPMGEVNQPQEHKNLELDRELHEKWQSYLGSSYV